MRVKQERTSLHLPAQIGDQIADVVTASLGSWTFIIIQSVVLALWIVLNSVAFITHWDPAPYILLNLLLSFQAAFTGPIVLLSQNRQSSKDRQRDNLEADEVQGLYSNHEELLKINRQLLALQNQQMEILAILQPKH